MSEFLVVANVEFEGIVATLTLNLRFLSLYSSVAQLVERQTVNLDVTGSCPVRGARTQIGPAASNV